DAEAEAREWARAIGERLEEKPRRELLVLVAVLVGASAIGHAVENAEGVLETTPREVAEDLHSQVAVGHDRSRQTAQCKGHRGGAAQACEPDRRPELAAANLQRRREPHVDVG